MQDLQEPLEEAVARLSWTAFRDSYRQKFKRDWEDTIFTVVASLTLLDSETSKLRVVGVGFGTKSLPRSSLIGVPGEQLLSDMHAQMLAVQALKRFVLSQMGKESPYFQRDEKRGKFSLRSRYQLVLYCSQVFCGDCCILPQEDSFSGAKPLRYLNSEQYPPLKYEPHLLRTKPGRVDLPPSRRSNLLSCSDLLALANLLGLQGPSLFSLVTPLYPHIVVVDCAPQLKPRLEQGIDMVFRLSQLLGRRQTLVERQLFNIVVDGKERKMSRQFRRHRPRVVVRGKTGESRDREGFPLCGIIQEGQTEWLNGKTGLPQGSSLKTFERKGRSSQFSQGSLRAEFGGYGPGADSFKYEAVEGRLRTLFGEWTTDQ